MITLAGLRYARVMASEGGPIARLVCGQACEQGEPVFSAQATLRDELMPSRLVRRLWSSADGGGTARSPLLARLKAVSEALERWAHGTLHCSSEAARYGFDIDPSSNGLAAFPGWRARQARSLAQWEAAERFNLLHWWEGMLPSGWQSSPWAGVDALVISSAAPGVTVVLHRREATGRHAFGHAAGATFAEACRRALGELERHAAVIRIWSEMSRDPVAAAMEIGRLGLQEQRSVFFSTDEGWELFRSRVAAAPRSPLANPRVVFDGAVEGPWSRYADVWRMVYAPPSRRFLSRDMRYFFW